MGGTGQGSRRAKLDGVREPEDSACWCTEYCSCAEPFSTFHLGAGIFSLTAGRLIPNWAGLRTRILEGSVTMGWARCFQRSHQQPHTITV